MLLLNNDQKSSLDTSPYKFITFFFSFGSPSFPIGSGVLIYSSIYLYNPKYLPKEVLNHDTYTDLFCRLLRSHAVLGVILKIIPFRVGDGGLVTSLSNLLMVRSLLYHRVSCDTFAGEIHFKFLLLQRSTVTKIVSSANSNMFVQKVLMQLLQSKI